MLKTMEKTNSVEGETEVGQRPSKRSPRSHSFKLECSQTVATPSNTKILVFSSAGVVKTLRVSRGGQNQTHPNEREREKKSK